MDVSAQQGVGATPRGGQEKATLGGGCFWCLEPVFASLKGVVAVEPGYAGGHLADPSYEQVCTGTTGHAEVVQVTFDPGEISYMDLLEVFFAVHDPTTVDRQGEDVGPQYRSAILYHSPEQKAAAKEIIARLEREGAWGGAPIVTEVTPFSNFYPAEVYHRDYFYRNPNQPYCRLVISPKMAKFRKNYKARLKSP